MSTPPIAPPPILTPPVVGPPPVVAKPPQKYSTAAVVVLAVVGAFGLFVMLCIVAAIAIPGLLRARMTANETSAIQRLREIASAEVAFAGTCGKGAYAESLSQLAAADSNAAADLSVDRARLGSSLTDGYTFTIGAGRGAAAGPLDCRGRPTVTTWYATAVPATYGTTGTRSFAVNTALDIWYQSGAGAPSEPFGPPAISLSK